MLATFLLSLLLFGSSFVPPLAPSFTRAPQDADAAPELVNVIGTKCTNRAPNGKIIKGHVCPD